MTAPLTITGGTVLGPAGPVLCDVTIEGDRITAIGAAGPAAGTPRLDATGHVVCPGFIDLQINGAHGIDLTTRPDRIAELAALLPAYGVTAFLPTVITCPDDVRRRALDAMAAYRHDAGAVAIGLHLEGPFLSAPRRGAHPAQHLRLPDPVLAGGWTRSAGVAMVTLAPELAGAPALIADLVAGGVLVSGGHTDATAGQFADGVAAGMRYATHLFNGMRPFAHRDPGPIGAVLGSDTLVAGLICDGLHVDPLAVRVAWRALGPHRLSLVSDAVAAFGGDGRAALGELELVAGADGVRTRDGVLAGSLLSIDGAVRNLIEFTGCSLAEAVATVTSTPADLLGLHDRGRIAVGARADLTVLDPQLGVACTIVGGDTVYGGRRWRS